MRCRFDTFLYLGSDVDVMLLRYMLPWERRAIFVDTFAPFETHWLSTFRLTHRADHRRSFHSDSGALRPWHHDASHNRRLAIMLLARMLDAPETFARPRIERFHPPVLSFVLDKQERTLRFRLADVEDRALYAALRGRVSTVASFGGPPLVAAHADLFKGCDHSAVRVVTDDAESSVPWSILSEGRLSDHDPRDALAAPRSLRFYWIRASNRTIRLSERLLPDEASAQRRPRDARTRRFSASLDKMPTEVAHKLQTLLGMRS
jgi:hypothetical protein